MSSSIYNNSSFESLILCSWEMFYTNRHEFKTSSSAKAYKVNVVAYSQTEIKKNGTSGPPKSNIWNPKIWRLPLPYDYTVWCTIRFYSCRIETLSERVKLKWQAHLIDTKNKWDLWCILTLRFSSVWGLCDTSCVAALFFQVKSAAFWLFTTHNQKF